ncbi:LysR family transcriptional regulator [Streptomyces sp. NPDC056519]|uniref:LysR family transcriptional regulator n=1 Tax=Streptomyces sp. NPDC056519 TaxID=3345849 RepID=UPI00369188D0
MGGAQPGGRPGLRGRHVPRRRSRARRAEPEVSSGSFTAAATRLGHTQSSVSRQAASLERSAGAALFERRPDGVRLTPAGLSLLRHARTVLDCLAAAEHDLTGAASQTANRRACTPKTLRTPNWSWPYLRRGRSPAAPPCTSTNWSTPRGSPPRRRRRNHCSGRGPRGKGAGEARLLLTPAPTGPKCGAAAADGDTEAVRVVVRTERRSARVSSPRSTGPA